MGFLVEFLLISGIILSAGGLLVSRHVLISTLCLAINTTLIGFLYILKGMLFIGVAQIAVYAGGIIILLLLTIMTLGLTSSVPTSLTQNIISGLVFVVTFVAVYFSLPDLKLSTSSINLESIGLTLSSKMRDHLIAVAVTLVAIFVTHSLLSNNGDNLKSKNPNEG